MNEIVEYFGHLNQQTTPLGAFDITRIFLSIALSFVLCFLVAHLYRRLNNARSVDINFLIALTVLGMVACFIMQAVGNNLARAFSLAGALSIVRFRNAVKDTTDIVAIFFVMAIGISCGANFFSLAILATLLIGFLWWLVTESPIKIANEPVISLQFNAQNTETFFSVLKNSFQKDVIQSNLRHIEEVQKNQNKFTYDVHLSKRKNPLDFYEALKGQCEKEATDVSQLSMYLHEQ
ncbi:MAG: DUF4956 domain-containing protein [Bdellovibrionales bacterium]|nr:DUF4956 domain-containing protein [Bdellovibrionales bacterium]